jgi:hypothetical protein
VPYFTADQIDPEPTPGRTTSRLYRRVKLPNLNYNGIVRYQPELEQLVDDVPTYIAAWLDRQANRLSYPGISGRLYSPVDVPLPDEW